MSVVFFSYSHKDEELRDQLEIHLTMLKRQGVIETWHDRRLLAGDPIDQGISVELERADVILLLVSPDFLASEYCYGVEMVRAMERHMEGSARVIPVILRPCEWHRAPFGALLATPADGRPVTKFANLDDAFLQITHAVRAATAASSRVSAQLSTGPAPPTSPALAQAAPEAPRSSNLRTRREFTQRDQDRFLDQSFEYMARFFENSLAELEARNPGIETDFKRLDATRFTAAAYRNGEERARCQIRLGGQLGGITYSYARHGLMDNSINESLSVVVGEQMLALNPLGMPMRGKRGEHLSAEGAAEYYWELFIEPLQR
jgi:TIR domain-containing protein